MPYKADPYTPRTSRVLRRYKGQIKALVPLQRNNMSIAPGHPKSTGKAMWEKIPPNMQFQEID